MHLRCPVDEVTPSATAQKRAAKHGGIPKLHTSYVLRVKPTVPTSAEDFKDVGMPERIGASAHKVRGQFRYSHFALAELWRSHRDATAMDAE
jgi:hypothetical protein